MKNRSFHTGIKRSPYEAVFGQPVKLGLKTTRIPDNIISGLNTEEELITALNEINLNEETQENSNTISNTISTDIIDNMTLKIMSYCQKSENSMISKNLVNQSALCARK
jgi:hypothetical protein